MPAARARVRRPLADDVRDEIMRDYIASGAVLADERLPSETELSIRYGVSRVTLRAAMRSLQEAGFVSIRQGYGTVVLPQSEELISGLDQLVSFETAARELGIVVGTDDAVMYELAATEELAEKLGISVGEPGLWIERVKTVAGDRVALMLDYIPERTLPNEQFRAEFDGTVLDVILAHPDLRAEYADCDVLPVVLDAELAGRLGAEPGTPALCMDEVTRRGDGRAIFWGKSWMLPGHLHFYLRRRRRLGL